MDEALVREVWERAANACEYCRIPHVYYFTQMFPIDHVIAKQHGGRTHSRNLALSCLHCNSHKGPNIAGIDPITGRLISLFNPRRHKWKRHFRWDGPMLVGRTAVGRVTIMVLAINDLAAIQVRRALIADGLFPLA